MTAHAKPKTSPSRRAGTRVPQAERIEATQRKIIESAQRLLREEGFKSATLQAIARGAQVSMGALQHHFESRDALMERLVDEALAPLGGRDGAGNVWPDPALPLRERAQFFVEQSWAHIYGATSYVTAWSLFFGCKGTPSIFDRIETKRTVEDARYFTMFVEAFPELREHHPYPKGFATSVFATLRGAGVFELFDVSITERHEELQALVETIVRACLPVAAESRPAPARKRASRKTTTPA
ncbi:MULTISPECIES: TetR/AcrR family transcriptional regulator [unclassified Paraburkholderia]|uniref:TetR/AcrR family transcriptional regulator n=1 Tax=unclassified Paraburkholderia TaxID=2615204 RepID=UPI002AB217BC|nr:MULTISPECIES: TetR/AcrR family transcriptional regulator [unclassified Paraburkholderia]